MCIPIYTSLSIYFLQRGGLKVVASQRDSSKTKAMRRNHTHGLHGRSYMNFASDAPIAVHLLEQNLDKIKWINLSHNPNAIHLLEQNPDRIDWGLLSSITN